MSNLFSDDIPHKKACELAAGRRKNLQTLFRYSRVIPFQWRDHYACIYCNTSCLTHDDLVKHSKSHDKIVIDKYLDKRRLKTTLQLDVSDMSCQLCDDNLKSLDVLIDHLVTKHDLKYDRQVQMLLEQYRLIDLSCPLCEEKFTEMAFLNLHVNSRHAVSFQCESCSDMFQKKKDLKLHNKLFHTDPYDDQIEICVKEEPGLSNVKLKSLDFDAAERKRIAKLRRENIACILNMSTAIPFKYYMNRFRCFYCTNNHTEFEPVRTHVINKHPYCDPSGKAMKSIKGKDAIVKIDISSLACKLCCISISDLDALSDHLISNHKTKYDKSMISIVQPFKIAKDNMACPLCPDVAFRYFVKLLEHMNESHSNNNVVCVYCGQTFRNTPSYRGHLARYHRGSECKCPDCDLAFPNIAKLTAHRANVHGTKTFKCSKCSEKFATVYLRQKHLIDAHGSGHKCSFCDRLFARNSYMKDHVRRLHLKEKNVECSVCKEKFFDKTRLNIHMVKHIGERNYHCDICGKTFLWKKNLRGHMSSHKRNA